MKHARLFSLGVWGFALFTVLAAGCAGHSDKVVVKLSSWGDVQENSILSGLIKDFEKSHPKTKVELQRIPYSEYLSKLLTQIAAGDAPDVIFSEVGNFTDLYLRNILEPLDSYVQTGHVDLAAYYPQVTDRFTIDGHLYILPRDTAPICVIYYN